MFVTPGYAQEAVVPHPPPDGEVGGAAATEHTEEHGTGIFPPFDSSTYASQLLWLAISFGLFYLFLDRVIMPRLAGILATREGRIAGDIEKANTAKAEADAAVAAYKQGLAEARAKANRISQDARDRAKADAEAERRQAEAALDARLGEAQARVDGVKASAMSNVGTIAADAAEAIVRQLTGRDADPAAVEAAVASARR